MPVQTVFPCSSSSTALWKHPKVPSWSCFPRPNEAGWVDRLHLADRAIGTIFKHCFPGTVPGRSCHLEAHMYRLPSARSPQTLWWDGHGCRRSGEHVASQSAWAVGPCLSQWLPPLLSNQNPAYHGLEQWCQPYSQRQVAAGPVVLMRPSATSS